MRMEKMRKVICLGLSIVIVANGQKLISLACSETDTTLSENDYVVILEDNTVLPNEQHLQTNELTDATGKVASIRLTAEEAEELRVNPDILAVEEEIILKGMSNNELDLADDEVSTDTEEYLIGDLEQWNLRAINLTSAHENPVETVKIEILDSGISYTDDIEVAEYVNLIPGEEDLSLLYEDSDGHGTGIGGMIAAKDNGEGITGINPNAELYSVKALDVNLESPLSRIVEGIYWGIENDMDIINMSFGTPVDSAVLRQAIKDAEEAGILLIAAAGNNFGEPVQYPAAYPEVIAVGSTNAEGQLAEHTSVGEELELLAPGEQIITTGLYYGILEVEGTSIAAAQVTGVASLLMERNHEKSPNFIRQLLKSSSKSVITEENNNAGLIDYGYAMTIYDDFEESETISSSNENIIEDYSEEANTVITGLWSNSQNKDGHYNSTVWAANSVGGISSRNIKMLHTSATNMDYLDKRINALHGRGNYVINLSFLWELAMELEKNDDKIGAINTVYNRVSSRCNLNPNGKDYQILKELKEGIDPYILQWNMISGSESDKVSRKFKILGAAMHMVGDICAHRTMVPTNGFSNFDPNHILTSAKAAPTDATLKNWLKNALESDAKAQLRAHANLSLFQRAISSGCMEFRDIDRFLKTQTVNGETKTIKNYADDATFFNVRFTITKNACARLLRAGSLAESRRIMIPRTHFIKFNNLKGYFIKAGGSETIIDYWSSVSTNGFV